MKKVFLCAVMVFVLCSCSTYTHNNNTQAVDGGIWISFYELNAMLKSESGFESEFQEVINNSKSLNCKNLYIHTRAFGETLYNSDYFPKISAAKDYDYDILDYIVKECHKAGLLVHAWINPYRISTNEEVEKLNAKSPAYVWLNDDVIENDENIAFAQGIYLNPATADVRSLILDGIRELLTNYDIDGIHFDDYFYPSQSETFDKISFAQYKKDGLLSLEEWRRENVNLLISSVYGTVKYMKKDVIFSISPAASIENNYNNLYADVALWIQEGWIDEIIPQLYFGFRYPDESFCFEALLKEWKSLVKSNPRVALKIGLAAYKAVPNLEADKSEWQAESDIIARQVKICDSDFQISGYVYFSYSSLFSNKAAYKKQLQNILDYLKQEKTNE